MTCDEFFDGLLTIGFYPAALADRTHVPWIRFLGFIISVPWFALVSPFTASLLFFIGFPWLLWNIANDNY